MNILPLIAAFLMLFALGAYTLLHQSMATHQEQKHFAGAERIHLKEIDEKTRALYKASPGKTTFPLRKNKKEVSEEPLAPYQSPRESFNLPESSKLSIYPLLTAKTPSPLLRQTALKLIQSIYERTSLYHPHLEEEILDTLIEVAGELDDVEGMSLQEFYPHLQREQELYYKLLKGTQSYKLYTDVGYPALSDFICLKKRDKPVCMAYACQALLVALFGDSFAAHVKLKEEELWEEHRRHRPAPKEEMLSLFLDWGPLGKNMSDFDPLLSYDREEKVFEQQIFFDKNSQIQLRVR